MSEGRFHGGDVLDQRRSHQIKLVINLFILTAQMHHAPDLANARSLLRLAVDVSLHNFSFVWVPSLLEDLDELHVFLGLGDGELEPVLDALGSHIFVKGRDQLDRCAKLLQVVLVTRPLPHNRQLWLGVQTLKYASESRLKPICLCHKICLTCQLNHGQLGVGRVSDHSD